MNGAEILLRTAVEGGVGICFANAGTTELPIVIALDSIPGIKAVLGVFEGVCTGAADGYGRMTGKPAMTLLHLGPGFANGIANLHNAKRAGTPLLNVIGEHATWHRAADPPLAMDIEALTGAVSGWQRTNASAGDISGDTADAIAAALAGQISSLIVPHNHQLSECPGTTIVKTQFSFAPVDSREIERVEQVLRSGKKTAIMLGKRALRRSGLLAAARIKAATGCDLFTETFPGYVERGAGLPRVAHLPYFPEEATAMLSGYQAVVLAGAHDPVTFFGYEGVDSFIISRDQEKIEIGTGGQDIIDVLEYLADSPGTSKKLTTNDDIFVPSKPPDIPAGELTGEKVSLVLAALQPEGAIIVDEGITTSFPYYNLSASAAPHTLLTITGGSIGYGMPCAIGAALACPDRPVINFQADGSALYTVQSLWTQARERLNVKTLLCSNRSYHILEMELARGGISSPGPNIRSLVGLDGPVIDWVKLAAGFGVPAASVRTAEDLARKLAAALAEPGPFLIEMIL
ncbi:MAG: acetolactate synthase large subunit [Syntrophorhabdaceae bacterium]|nr:acetolactate synthase large subunit [Syntrophorhabdaceae bacterium]MDD5243611.1 acetolactate synthase large subunit [Syntrophorhabdaceae bacterium]